MLSYLIEPETGYMSDSIETTSWSVRNIPTTHKLVEDLCNIHNDLCDACSIGASYFGLKMIAIFGTAFLSIVLDGYEIYLRLLAQDINLVTKQEMVEAIYLIMQSIMVFLGVLLICNSGHNLTSQVL